MKTLLFKDTEKKEPIRFVSREAEGHPGRSDGPEEPGEDRWLRPGGDPELSGPTGGTGADLFNPPTPRQKARSVLQVAALYILAAFSASTCQLGIYLTGFEPSEHPLFLSPLTFHFC